MPSSPRVTVLTTVFNCERYLDEAIESIRGEVFTDLEHVIVDDGSTDSTPEILARAAARDPRLVVLRNPVNIGIAASANRGLAIARGEYVARLDADDVSVQGRLGRQVAFLDANRDVVLVSMNYESMTANGVVFARSYRDHPPEVVTYLLNFSNSLGGHSQVMFRRTVVERLGGYDETCHGALDYDLWARLASVGRIVVLPEIGMRYRVHSESMTAGGRARQLEVGHRVAKQMLSAHLGRPLTDLEVDAVTQAWRWDGGPEPNHPRLANAILREAYAIFAASHDESSCSVVRRVTARVLVNRTIVLVKERAFRHAFRHWVDAFRWDAMTAMIESFRRVRGLASRVTRSGRRFGA